MKRRDFITLFGGAATAPVLSPFVVRAQQPATPVIGFCRSSALADSTRLVNAFRQGLKEAGFIEGQNVSIEYRYADNQIDRVPALVAELIRWPVAVLAVRMPTTRPRRPTNQRVATVAPRTSAVMPVPNPTTKPQSRTSCHTCVMNSDSTRPPTMRVSADTTTLRTP